MKKRTGTAKVVSRGMTGEVAVSLEERPPGEWVFSSRADILCEQPYLAREAGALSGLRYASTQKRHRVEGMALFLDVLNGDATPSGFSVAACLSTKRTGDPTALGAHRLRLG
jgi:hypothetical protein